MFPNKDRFWTATVFRPLVCLTLLVADVLCESEGGFSHETGREAWCSHQGEPLGCSPQGTVRLWGLEEETLLIS